MTKNSFYGFISLALISFIFISSCENPGNSLEESVAPYLELQAVDGASNTSITVNRGVTQGLDSYFALDFSNIEPNGLITEGLTEGWCLDWTKPIQQNNDVHAGIKMFNTHGSDNWKPANYLMNIKDELKQADPSLTYREIQVALWSLIKVPSFDIDNALSKGTMPSRMMSDGAPNFSVKKTKQIVSRVRSEVNDFEYKVGTPALAYSKMSDLQQPPGGIFGESAWGIAINDNNQVDTNKSIEFCKNEWDGKTMPEKWGWSNGTYTEGSSGTLALYAGAGGCDINGTDAKYAGTFSFSYDGNKLNFTLNLEIENDFKDLHIHAGNEVLPLHNNGKKYQGAPGQFDFPYDIEIENDDLEKKDDNIGSFTKEIEGLSGDIFISVHLGG